MNVLELINSGFWARYYHHYWLLLSYYYYIIIENFTFKNVTTFSIPSQRGRNHQFFKFVLRLISLLIFVVTVKCAWAIFLDISVVFSCTVPFLHFFKNCSFFLQGDLTCMKNEIKTRLIRLISSWLDKESEVFR